MEETDAVKNPELIRLCGLKVTLTIIILDNDVVRELPEGIVHAEQTEAILKKIPVKWDTAINKL